MIETKPIAGDADALTTGQIVDYLRAVADQIAALGDQPIERTWVNIGLQVTRPGGHNDRMTERSATVDLLATAFGTTPYSDEEGWRHADVFHGLNIYAAPEKKSEPVLVGEVVDAVLALPVGQVA